MLNFCPCNSDWNGSCEPRLGANTYNTGFVNLVQLSHLTSGTFRRFTHSIWANECDIQVKQNPRHSTTLSTSWQGESACEEGALCQLKLHTRIALRLGLVVHNTAHNTKEYHNTEVCTNKKRSIVYTSLAA